LNSADAQKHVLSELVSGNKRKEPGNDFELRDHGAAEHLNLVLGVFFTQNCFLEQIDGVVIMFEVEETVFDFGREVRGNLREMLPHLFGARSIR
jgi:hypothetical protein